MKLTLVQLRRLIREESEFKSKIELPSDHHIGMRVPHGGSCCANCKFAKMEDDGPHCMNTYWSDAPKDLGGGGGDTRLPVDDPKDWCCDVYAVSKKK